MSVLRGQLERDEHAFLRAERDRYLAALERIAAATGTDPKRLQSIAHEAIYRA